MRVARPVRRAAWETEPVTTFEPGAIDVFTHGLIARPGRRPSWEQLTTWLPESGESPDRIDGMVWAGTRLLIVEEDESGFFWERDSFVWTT